MLARIVEIFQNNDRKMEFYDSKCNFPPYFLNLPVYLEGQIQTFFNWSKISLIFARKSEFLWFWAGKWGWKKPELTRSKMFVSFKDLRQISKLELNEYIRRTIRPWYPLRTTTPSRGSLSKSRYIEVQLVKEPLFGFPSMAAPIRVGHTKKFIKHKL